MTPACTPAKSLTPLKQTKCTPSPRSSDGVGSCSMAARRAMVQDEQKRCGAIVGYRGRFRAAENGQIVLQIGGAGPAFTGAEIVFEVVIIRADGRCRLNHRRGQRRAAKVGVDENPSAV